MCFWRAPTDNDFGAWKVDKRPQDTSYFQYRKSSQEFELINQEEVKISDGFQLVYTFYHPLLNARNTIIYTVLQNGSLHVKARARS